MESIGNPSLSLFFQPVIILECLNVIRSVTVMLMYQPLYFWQCLCWRGRVKFEPPVWKIYNMCIITTTPSGHFVLVLFKSSQQISSRMRTLLKPMQRFSKPASTTNDGCLIHLTSHWRLYRCSNCMVVSRYFLSLHRQEERCFHISSSLKEHGCSKDKPLCCQTCPCPTCWHSVCLKNKEWIHLNVFLFLKGDLIWWLVNIVNI